MRIGNGPRLVVPRPGNPGRRHYSSLHWLDRGQAYDEHRERERARLRAMPGPATWDRKGQVMRAYRVPHGEHFRLVDGHGRAYGPRYWSPVANVPFDARVRRVKRQEEDLHSQLSRMLKRAHRLAIRDN